MFLYNRDIKPIKIVPDKRHYPYKAAIGWVSQGKDCWWPESSYPDDRMVIGDGVPGDQKSAELCARCCNIAYQDALEDVNRLMKQAGIDISHILSQLTKK